MSSDIGMSAINLPGVFISIGVGVVVWLVATFVIAGITKSVAAGTSLFKKPHFRWVAPALRALDHERRVQRANTIGSLLNSVVSVLVAVITIMYVLSNLNVNIAPLLTSVGILGVAIGSISFAGSMIAFGKLQELISGRPISYPNQQQVNAIIGIDGVFGPATRSLPQLPIELDSEGFFVARSDYREAVGPSYWNRVRI